MNIRELEAQAKALAPVLKSFVAKALSSFKTDLQKELDARDKRLADTVSESLEGIPTDAAEIARAAAALIPAPRDGSDADPEEIRLAVAAEVAKLPAPQDGKSVTLEDVLPSIQEGIASAVATLPVPEPGKDGKSFTLEEVQELVNQAVAKALEVIPVPKDGVPGRDALDIEILPEIDDSKSYRRGTFAKHAGGLWRSFEATHAMKGWECIVEGIASASVDQAGDRGIEVHLTLSSGIKQSKSFNLPAMIYRGVFTPGSYDAGDTVTWAGSLWHCDDSTSDKPGEPGSKGWRLAVKRGRDGKDGINGKDLTAGVKIT